MTPDRELLTESQLIVQARAGSLDALGELFRRYSDMVHTAAYRITLSADDAADVLQDVFVGLPRALQSYRDYARFEAWLKRVAVRTSLMRLRAQRRKAETTLDAAAQLERPTGVTPVDRIALERALAGLPEKFRTVFVLKELEGYSHAEIAGFMGISTANSAARLTRAWSALRKALRHDD